MTNIDDNEEDEMISLPPASLIVENETDLTSETEIKEGELVINQILDEIIDNALNISRKK